jgi:hypothetical protein
MKVVKQPSRQMLNYPQDVHRDAFWRGCDRPHFSRFMLDNPFQKEVAWYANENLTWEQGIKGWF